MFPRGGKTVFTARNIWQIEKTVFHSPETIFFFRLLFLVVETVTEINRSQFLKKGYVLINAIDFLASANHFFPIFSGSGQLLLVEAVFPSTGTYFSANFSFRPVEISFLSAGNSIVLFRVFSVGRNYYWN